MMLDISPENRPTTIGLKDHAPLKNNQDQVSMLEFQGNEKWHFELPPLTRNRSISSKSENDSGESIIVN